MHAESALADIRGYALAGRVACARHARERMQERGVQPRDVRHALATARSCRRQEAGRWCVGSTDLDGDELTVVVRIEDGLVVVTVY